jgi:hypothetical protein
MRHAALFALLCAAAALVVLALVFVPLCLGPLIETPPEWRWQRKTMRQNALDTVKKFEDRHGNKPVEKWPEGDRQTYSNAKRILAEMEGKP